ncbi:MAG: type II toxin-antitoxin system HipA family toxin [Pseudonocardiaceae bacterium]|nr:type II toxin-antitoxin system HipA family toxin [Pseudonocardiaceae bacterium]
MSTGTNTGEIGVYVTIDGSDVFAGRLYAHRRRGTDSASFGYDPRYLARPDAYALDPELRLVTGSQHTPAGRALFGAFADSAPDRWGRTLIKRAERVRAKEAGTTARSITEIDFLLGVRDDLRQGALRFRTDESGPFLATVDAGVPQLTDLPELLNLAAHAEDDTAGYDELNRLVRAGSSLGGARPKAHVTNTDGRIAIAKFPSANVDTWNVMAWEQTALDLARSAGLVVPDSRLVKVGTRHVLVVDRFDRTADGDRIGYVSAMTMLAARDGDERSYLEIAEVIEERSDAATIELEQLWGRIAFSVLISNTDDHLRNHGFLHTRGEVWNLAPAFDLNPNPEPGAKYLATAIDEAETEASVDLLLEVADYFRLSREHALGVLGQVSAAVAGWRQVATGNGLDERDIAEMAPAFEHSRSERAREVTGIVV